MAARQLSAAALDTTYISALSGVLGSLLRHITEYFSTNMTLEEMRRIALAEGADPLKLFGEACRRELSSMRARL